MSTRYELTDLKIFLAVADEGNLTRGAQRCHLASSTVSLRLKGLEEAVGTPLFVREPRGVTLTQAGLIMLDHVRRCNAQLEQMHADLSPFVAGLAQRVTIFANNNVISSFLPQDLARFFAAHRQVRVTLEERMGTEILAAVTSGRADLGIVTVSSDEPSLQFIAYREDRFVLVAPRLYGFDKASALRFRRCLDYPFISLQNGTSLHAFLTNQASALGQTLDMRVQVSSHRSILNLVAAGAGLTIVPLSTLTEDDHRQLDVIALEDEWALRHHHLCVRREALQQNAMVRALVDTLTAPT